MAPVLLMVGPDCIPLDGKAQIHNVRTNFRFLTEQASVKRPCMYIYACYRIPISQHSSRFRFCFSDARTTHVRICTRCCVAGSNHNGCKSWPRGASDGPSVRRAPSDLSIRWRGPGLGAINLVFPHVSDQTRLAAPIDVRRRPAKREEGASGKQRLLRLRETKPSHHQSLSHEQSRRPANNKQSYCSSPSSRRSSLEQWRLPLTSI